MNDALNYLIGFVLQIAAFMFVARFLIQACRVDFYNPVSQGVVKATDPILRPMRMVLPGYRNLDLAAFVAAVLAQIVLIMSLGALQGTSIGHAGVIVAAGVLQILMLIIRIFWWSILIVIVAGWIAPGSNHPALGLLHQLTERLLAPARRLLPSLGGLDFSPIMVFLILGLLERILPQIFAAMF